MLQRATVRCHSAYPITFVWRSFCNKTPLCSDRAQTGLVARNRRSCHWAGRYPRGLPIHFLKSCWTQSRHPDKVELTSLLRVSRASFYEHFICARWDVCHGSLILRGKYMNSFMFVCILGSRRSVCRLVVSCCVIRSSVLSVFRYFSMLFHARRSSN